MSEVLGDCPRIGLLNLMPAPALPKTEHQWRDAFRLAADIVPVRFDDDPRKDGCRSADLLDEYEALADVQDSLDGLVITGANLEVLPDGSPLPFEDIEYIVQLREAINWAEENTKLTVYSCLASHIALNHLFDIHRDIQSEKVFGVFCHDIVQSSSLTDGLTGVIRSPHSRWGHVPAKLLNDAGIEVLVEGFEPGWLLASRGRSRGTTVFLQGHPEYERDDLAAEYRRDAAAGQPIPHKYFPTDNPNLTPAYTWHEDRQRLFTNLASLATKPTLAGQEVQPVPTAVQ